jgi:hydroxyquinol 1,2-dioxygenase
MTSSPSKEPTAVTAGRDITRPGYSHAAAPAEGTALLDAGQQRREEELTQQVLGAFARTESPRLRQLLTRLAWYMHAYIREVRLTEDEWNSAIRFLTDVGHATTDRRQEYLLLGDMFGLPMLVVDINNPASGAVTEATLLGPFFGDGGPLAANGDDITAGASGEPAWIEGTVRDADGTPVTGAKIEVWGCDADGLYDVQYDDGRVTCRAHLFTDSGGRYRFWALRPVPYAVPTDGPVGILLEVTSRPPMRTAHLHLRVSAAGYRTLVTNIFDADDDTQDTVFGTKESLARKFDRHPPDAPAPDGRQVGRPWSQARFDMVLAADGDLDDRDGLGQTPPPGPRGQLHKLPGGAPPARRAVGTAAATGDAVQQRSRSPGPAGSLNLLPWLA